MKEHALFLEAGFPGVNESWIQRADYFREQFENLLREAVELGDGRVNEPILNSNELVRSLLCRRNDVRRYLVEFRLIVVLRRIQKN